MKINLLLVIAIISLASNITFGQPGVMRKYLNPIYIDPLDINIKDFGSINTPLLIQEANIFYSKGDYIRAAKNYLLVVNNSCNDGESYYRLSLCYGHLENAVYASHFLRMAVEAGFNSYSGLKDEEAYKKIRRDPNFRKALDEIIAGSKSIGEIVWIEQTRFDKVRLFYPDNYDSEKSYPLLIALHGRGDNASNFSRLRKSLEGMEIILAVPEGPYIYNTSNGLGMLSHSWDILTRDRELMERADPAVSSYIANISKTLNARFRVSSTILLGFSQGAAYAYSAGIRYYSLFDGLICFGGRLPDINLYPWYLNNDEINKAKGLKVFIGHGSADLAINYKEGEESFENLKRRGYNVRLSLFNGGHYIPDKELAEAILWITEN